MAASLCLGLKVIIEIDFDFDSVYSELIRRSVPNNLMGMSRREIDFDFDEVSLFHCCDHLVFVD